MEDIEIYILLKEGKKLIAEIHNKISKDGRNLSDRMEDQLTGDFFGTLRYIPFNRGLKVIFTHGVYPKSTADVIEKIDKEQWDVQFWRRSHNGLGEIDASIEFEDTIIGIEVKLYSNLSSDDNISYSDSSENDMILKESKNQLNREARMLKEWAPNNQKILLFVADEKSCQNVYSNIVNERHLLDKDIIFGYLSWQDALEGLEKVKANDCYEELMINDLISLLKGKGFERFKGFSFAKQSIDKDYWQFKDNNNKFSFNTKIEVGVEKYEFRKKHA